MMTRLFATTALALVLGTSAGYTAKSPASSDKDPVIAIVNGNSIHLSDFYEQLPAQLRQGKLEDIYGEFLPQVIDSALLVEAALKENIQENPAAKKDIKTAQNQARNLVLQRYYLKAHLKEPTDADVKTQYSKMKAELSNVKQYKLRHILLAADKDPQGEKAQKIHTDLKGGASFEELAKKHSHDTLSAPRGGDIGWVRLEDLPPELAEKVSTLNDKELADSPIKTSFGWHVLERLESKNVELPPLEDEQVKLLVRLKMMDDFMKSEVLGKLRKNAKIQVFDLNGKPLSSDAKNQ